VKTSVLSTVPVGTALELKFATPRSVPAVSTSGVATSIHNVAVVTGRLAQYREDSIFIGSATARLSSGRRSGPYRIIAADTSCTVRRISDPDAFANRVAFGLIYVFAMLILAAEEFGKRR
jgi:hypothetical protein